MLIHRDGHQSIIFMQFGPICHRGDLSGYRAMRYQIRTEESFF